MKKVRLMEAVDAYEKALEMAPDNMSKASIHKNMTIAYELLCKLGSL
jgi:ribosomal protein S5